MTDGSFIGGRAPTLPARTTLGEVATRLAAMAYVGWGAWTLAAVHGLAQSPAASSSREGVFLMTFIALQAMGLGAWMVWRARPLGHALCAAGATWAQLGTCIGTSYAWLPVGFVGPLFWGLALGASALALLQRADRKEFSR